MQQSLYILIGSIITPNWGLNWVQFGSSSSLSFVIFQIFILPNSKGPARSPPELWYNWHIPNLLSPVQHQPPRLYALGTSLGLGEADAGEADAWVDGGDGGSVGLSQWEPTVWTSFLGVITHIYIYIYTLERWTWNLRIMVWRMIFRIFQCFGDF